MTCSWQRAHRTALRAYTHSQWPNDQNERFIEHKGKTFCRYWVVLSGIYFFSSHLMQRKSFTNVKNDFLYLSILTLVSFFCSFRTIDKQKSQSIRRMIHFWDLCKLLTFIIFRCITLNFMLNRFFRLIFKREIAFVCAGYSFTVSSENENREKKEHTTKTNKIEL